MYKLTLNYKDGTIIVLDNLPKVVLGRRSIRYYFDGGKTNYWGRPKYSYKQVRKWHLKGFDIEYEQLQSS